MNQSHYQKFEHSIQGPLSSALKNTHWRLADKWGYLFVALCQYVNNWTHETLISSNKWIKISSMWPENGK